MKKLFLICFCISFVGNLIAQNSDENAFNNKFNEHYWKNRKPDAGYWQQDVHYTIEAQINEKSKIVEASEKLVYTNNSPFQLPFVYFHLYQNAFVKGSYLADLHKANKQPITYFGKYA
nr:hypothetical protein [Chitinophagaceae bacterium]